MIAYENSDNKKSKKFSSIKLIKFIALPVLLVSIGIFLVIKSKEDVRNLKCKDGKCNSSPKNEKKFDDTIQNLEQEKSKNEEKIDYVYLEETNKYNTVKNVVPPPTIVKTQEPTVPNSDSTVPNLDSTVPNPDPPVPNLDSKVPNSDPPVPNLDSKVPNLDSTVPNLDSTVPNLDSTVPNLDPTVPNLDPAVPIETAASTSDILKTEEPPIITTTVLPSCKIEVDVNYPKDDLSELKAETQEDCCNACIKTENCKAWAYLVAGKYCFLKNALPNPAHRRDYKGIIYGSVSY